MGIALQEAHRAARLDEVPVGAAVAAGGRVLATAHNRRAADGDPTGHAEILALRQAGRVLGDWRLEGATLYVTLEPCVMCAGAAVWSRVERLVYGAADAKAGAVESLYHIPGDERLNHQLKVTGGLLAQECGALLRQFFQRRRSD